MAADWLAALALVGITLLYFWRLDAWLINDDEGSYLYAAWRISLGELPYRDFLTPQLPAFLLSGGLAFRGFGASVLVGRSIAVALTLLSGVALWASVRHLFGPVAALTAGLVLLLHPDVYLHCRTFRPEPFMLFATCAGLYLVVRGALSVPAPPGSAAPLDAEGAPDRRWLALAGVAFGLGILCKLFAVLPLGACAVWLLHDAARARRASRAALADAALVVGTAFAVAAAGLALFAAGGAPVWEAVIGHHLMQGAGLSRLEVLRKALGLYAEFLRYNNNALVTLVALAVATVGLQQRLRGACLFAWQLPTGLVFFFLTRELWTRHLIYLLPSLAALFGLAIHWLAAGWSAGALPWGRTAQRLLGQALVAAFLLPALLVDRDTGWRSEDGTRRMADFVALTTEPEAVVFSDYSELNFYARRPTTYSAASLSAGAAKSGQITWQRLHRELSALGATPPLVLVDRTRVDEQEYGQLRFLHDLADFEGWLAAGYERAGVFRRDPQQFEVYRPRRLEPPVLAAVADGPTLLATACVPQTARVGEAVVVTTAWQSEGRTSKPLMATLRLVDGEGREWAQADRALTATRLRLTDAWLAEELTAERFELVIPPGTPPGAYSVRLSLYAAGELEPVALSAADGRSLGRAIVVGHVEVPPWLASPAEARRAMGESALSVGPATHSRRGTPSAAVARWGGLELIGQSRPEPELQAGSTWTADLWWRAAAALDDMRVRLQLVDPTAAMTVGQAVQDLGQPGIPSSRWPVGTVARQQITVPVLPWARDGHYWVTVDVQDKRGRGLGPDWVLGTVRVKGRDLSGVVTKAPPVGQKVGTRFGETAELYGATVQPATSGAQSPAGDSSAAALRLAPGTRLRVRLVWRGLGPSARSNQVTVQLVSPAGRIVGQHDGVPAGGRRPTTSWLPGEYIADDRELTIAADAQPGRYDLLVALYDPWTMERLAVEGANSDRQARVARLGSVAVGD